MDHLSISLQQWGMIFLQLVIATVLGGAIGYQRELQDHPAGFRTHMLVCVGSTVYMLVSVVVAGDRFDPGRIAAQVASGIGFLGAGTIIKQGSVVRGLTTAASLWAVAGIGLAVGAGWTTMAIAILGTLIVFTALSAMKRIEEMIEHSRVCTMHLVTDDAHAHVNLVRQTFTEHGIDVRSLQINERDGEGEIIIEGRISTEDDLHRAVDELTREKAIRAAHWRCR